MKRNVIEKLTLNFSIKNVFKKNDGRIFKEDPALTKNLLEIGYLQVDKLNVSKNKSYFSVGQMSYSIKTSFSFFHV